MHPGVPERLARVNFRSSFLGVPPRRGPLHWASGFGELLELGCASCVGHAPHRAGRRVHSSTQMKLPDAAGAHKGTQTPAKRLVSVHSSTLMRPSRPEALHLGTHVDVLGCVPWHSVPVPVPVPVPVWRLSGAFARFVLRAFACNAAFTRDLLVRRNLHGRKQDVCNGRRR